MVAVGAKDEQQTNSRRNSSPPTTFSRWWPLAAAAAAAAGQIRLGQQIDGSPADEQSIDAIGESFRKKTYRLKKLSLKLRQFGATEFEIELI